jgi:branched-chain amino acid aminotransferase
MAMPVVPENMFIAAVRKLVEVDQNWVPGGDGSLYLRPFMFASEAFLGVRPAAEYTFCRCCQSNANRSPHDALRSLSSTA